MSIPFDSALGKDAPFSTTVNFAVGEQTFPVKHDLLFPDHLFTCKIKGARGTAQLLI